MTTFFSPPLFFLFEKVVNHFFTTFVTKKNTVQLRSRVIVLHTLRYNDDALIAHLFTEAEGYVTMWVRVSRRSSQVRHTLFQPLAILEVEWAHRAKAQFQRPKWARMAVPYTDLPYNGHKLTISLFLAEFLGAALRMEPASALLFSYVEQSVRWLDACRGDFANFHLVFLLRLTQFLGFLPPVENHQTGSYYDMEQCRFCAERPLSPHLEPHDAALLPLLLRINYDNMRHFRFSGEQRNRFLTVLNDYFRLHLSGFPVLKSLDVLREVYQKETVEQKE